MHSKIPRKIESRLLSVDTMRGFAMILVLLHHSYLSVDYSLLSSWLNSLIRLVTALAAIAFVMISGIMYSFFLYEANEWREKYRRYSKRALFLLLFAHPAINLSSYFFRFEIHSHESIFQNFVYLFLVEFPISDTIGLCMLVAPVLIIKVKPIARCMLIILTLLLCNLLRYSFTSLPPALTLVIEALIGAKGGEPVYIWYPFLPWLAVFLSGSYIGLKLSKMIKGELQLSATILSMRNAGILLMGLTLVLIILSKSVKMFIGNAINRSLYLAISADRLTILFPGYIAILILSLSWLMTKIELHGNYNRVFWLLAIMGRTSLFTFIIQFAVIESCPALLGFKGNIGLAGFSFLFVLGTSIVTIISFIYGRLRGFMVKNDFSFNKQQAMLWSEYNLSRL